MPDVSIGRLMRVALREVWRHEALDFTTWLTMNPEILGEALGVTLTNVEREHAAGAFAADMRVEDDAGNIVVIENQLERSDHDHLGKLVTYVAALGAKIAVWIVSEPRPEHVGAINWLNERGVTSFYLLKLEAVKIGDSSPAPLLTRITGPSQETIEIGRTKEEVAERHLERQEFWRRLLERSKDRTRLFNTISPGTTGWIATGTGKSGVRLVYVVWREESAIELYVDCGDSTENDLIFQKLIASKNEIEAEFGGPLDWQPLEGRRACRVRKRLSLGGYRTPDRWEAAHDAMIETMIRFEKAFRRHLSAL